MSRILYQPINFKSDTLETIALVRKVFDEYASLGIPITLRQLYYRFVSNNWIKNTQKEYKRLGKIVNDARLAGMLDWDMLVDRTRGMMSYPGWDSVEELVGSTAGAYRRDLWATQERRVPVWIEKDALEGVIEGPCSEFRVPYLSCRGYTSQTEMHVSAMKAVRAWHGQGYVPGSQRSLNRRGDPSGQRTLILHFGDHDPSGMDMSRDIDDRMNLFCRKHGAPAPEIRRIALNMDQVQQYNPPPNAAKTTDKRYEKYAEEFGNESWELDALEPKVLIDLIRDNVRPEIDREAWNEELRLEREGKDEIAFVTSRWDRAVELLREDM